MDDINAYPNVLHLNSHNVDHFTTFWVQIFKKTTVKERLIKNWYFLANLFIYLFTCLFIYLFILFIYLFIYFCKKLFYNSVTTTEVEKCREP